MNAGQHGRREQHIAAEPDIGLLADRDEPGIAGEQVPQARQRDIGVDFGEQPQVVAPAPGRRRGKQHDSDGERGRADAARRGSHARRGSDAVIPAPSGTGPRAARARTTRKARWPAKQLPARIDLRADRLRHAEDDAARERAPHAAEPADDHRLEAEDQPRRARSPDRSWCARRGRRRRPRRRASDSAMASAKTWRLSRPISCATD